MARIRIPKRFLDDHEERELPTPDYRSWRGGYVIDTDDPHFAELMDDAKYYCDDVDQCEPGLKRAAKSLVKTVAKEIAFLAATDSKKAS